MILCYRVISKSRVLPIATLLGYLPFSLRGSTPERAGRKEAMSPSIPNMSSFGWAECMLQELSLKTMIGCHQLPLKSILQFSTLTQAGTGKLELHFSSQSLFKHQLEKICGVYFKREGKVAVL